MTRFYTLLLAGSVLGGCALGTAIDTSRVGDECIQHSYSRNIWWPNWDRVAVKEVDANGACARESFGQGAAKGVLGNAPIGIGLGLLRIQQSTGGYTVNEHFTTKMVGK